MLAAVNLISEKGALGWRCFCRALRKWTKFHSEPLPDNPQVRVTKRQKHYQGLCAAFPRSRHQRPGSLAPVWQFLSHLTTTSTLQTSSAAVYHGSSLFSQQRLALVSRAGLHRVQRETALRPRGKRRDSRDSHHPARAPQGGSKWAVPHFTKPGGEPALVFSSQHLEFPFFSHQSSQWSKYSADYFLLCSRFQTQFCNLVEYPRPQWELSSQLIL